MLKFFRRIRQNLLSENKFTKYLLYAIGEIILVVIGILIALQINTRNEENKTKRLEVKILKEIHNNLKIDLDGIQEDIAAMDSINRACREIKEFLKMTPEPNNKFYLLASTLRVIPHFDPNKSGYGLLQSKGVEVISNDSLRNDISLLYERAYTYYRRYEDERIAFHNLQSEPKLLDYFHKNFDNNSTWFAKYHITQQDYNKLKVDESFSKLLSAIAFENSAVQNRAQRTEKRILNLLQFIESELNKELTLK